MTRRTGAVCLLIAIALPCLRCSSSETGGVAGPDYYVTITNAWVDASDPDHSFLLASSDDGLTSGTFTGEETLPNAQTYSLSGSWADNVVEFTVDRDGVTTTYRADVTANDPTTLVFEAGDESITLQTF